MFNHVPTPKYNLNSITTDFGRYYQSPTSKLWYPSVTTVVGYADRNKFDDWRKIPGNAEVSKRALDRGENLHLGIENYINNDPKYKNTFKSVNCFLFDQIKESLDKIQNIRLQESSLWSDELRIAGRVDCVAEYNGKLSLIDFKGSGKEKKEKYINSYFEQTTFYCMMYKNVYNIPVNNIVIMITSEDGSSQIFEKNPKDYIPDCVEKYNAYWKDNNFDEIQEKVKKYNEK